MVRVNQWGNDRNIFRLQNYIIYIFGNFKFVSVTFLNVTKSRFFRHLLHE